VSVLVRVVTGRFTDYVAALTIPLAHRLRGGSVRSRCLMLFTRRRVGTIWSRRGTMAWRCVGGRGAFPCLGRRWCLAFELLHAYVYPSQP
jgi:hypothetical protein